MPRWLILPLLCMCMQVNAQSPACGVAENVLIGYNRIAAIKAVGEPYNRSFQIKEDAITTEYVFLLDKDKFIELYLTFDAAGQLQEKRVVGTDC